MIGGFPDLDALQARAKALLQEKGLTPIDQAVLCVDFLHTITGAMVRSQWPKEDAYHRAFKAFVDDCRKTGRPGIQANTLVMAWALRQLQDSEIMQRPNGGGAA